MSKQKSDMKAIKSRHLENGHCTVIEYCLLPCLFLSKSEFRVIFSLSLTRACAGQSRPPPFKLSSARRSRCAAVDRFASTSLWFSATIQLSLSRLSLTPNNSLWEKQWEHEKCRCWNWTVGRRQWVRPNRNSARFAAVGAREGVLYAVVARINFLSLARQRANAQTEGDRDVIASSTTALTPLACSTNAMPVIIPIFAWYFCLPSIHSNCLYRLISPDFRSRKSKLSETRDSGRGFDRDRRGHRRRLGGCSCSYHTQVS